MKSISRRQMLALTFVAMLSPFLRLIPRQVAAAAGRAAWLSPWTALPVLLALIGVLAALLKCAPGQGLARVSCRVLGNGPGKAAMVIWSLWLCLHSGFLLRSGADRFIGTIFPDSDPWIFVIVMALLALVDNLRALAALEGGSFTGISTDAEDTEAFTITEVPYDSVPQKEHLTLATLYLESGTQNAIIKFNRDSDKYRIDAVDYSQYDTSEDYNARRTKLLTEIMAGNVPDILCVSSDLPYRRLAAKGLLADLTPYIEADRELKLDDFFPNVISALTVDGKLCAACSSFGVQTVAGAASVVGDTSGWTYDDYFAALEKMPEGCEGFDFGVDKSNMLMVCTALDMDNLVDWSTGECRFDSEDFIKMLGYCASFPDTPDGNYQYSAEDSSTARIAAGKQMLYMASFTGTDYMTDD